FEARGGRGDHLDRAAGQAKRHGPDRRLARPVKDVVHRGDQEILLELVLQPSHEWSSLTDLAKRYTGSLGNAESSVNRAAGRGQPRAPASERLRQRVFHSDLTVRCRTPRCGPLPYPPSPENIS